MWYSVSNSKGEDCMENRVNSSESNCIPNESTRLAIENVNHNRNLSRSFNSVDELMADLYADEDTE